MRARARMYLRAQTCVRKHIQKLVLELVFFHLHANTRTNTYPHTQMTTGNSLKSLNTQLQQLLHYPRHRDVAILKDIHRAIQDYFTAVRLHLETLCGYW